MIQDRAHPRVPAWLRKSAWTAAEAHAAAASDIVAEA